MVQVNFIVLDSYTFLTVVILDEEKESINTLMFSISVFLAIN